MKRKPYPSQAYLHECFRYEDGKLYWKERPREHFISEKACIWWNSKFKNKLAGSITSNYRDVARDYRCRISIDSEDYYRSVLIWIMFNGDRENDELQIDHKDRDGLNDKIENLRIATNGQNAYNKRIQRNNKTGCKGIHWDKEQRKYRIILYVNKKKINIGRFKTLEEAKLAYQKAVQEYYGEFATSE